MKNTSHLKICGVAIYSVAMVGEPAARQFRLMTCSGWVKKICNPLPGARLNDEASEKKIGMKAQPLYRSTPPYIGYIAPQLRSPASEKCFGYKAQPSP